MIRSISRRLMSGTVAACLFTTCASAFAQHSSPDVVTPEKLSIERLYSLPWVIGTQPKGFIWSSDSRRVAFLWNDQGTNFYDVWTADVETGKPVRVTSMPRPKMPEDPGTDIAKLQQVAAAETDGGVSSVIWAPDGKQLIFSFKGQLYRVQPGQAAQPLLDSTALKTNVAAAPRENRVAFISSGDLWVVSLAGDLAKAQKVTAISRKDIAVEDFRWSSDGKSLAFIESDESHMPVRGIPDYLGEETKLVPVKRPFPGEPSEYRRLGFVSGDGGEVTWADLGSNPLDLIFGVAWSPDSKTVLVDKSDLYIKDRRLLLVDPQSGKSSLLLREADPKNVTAEWWADWSPDGRGVYFISDRDNDYHVYYQALAGGEPKRITVGDWAVFSAVVSPEAKALFIVSNEGKPEERHLFKVSLEGGDPQRLTLTVGTHKPTVSPDGRFAADAFSNDLTPPDLYLLRLDEESSQRAAGQQVTHSPLPEFKEYKWVPAQYVTFHNVNDGTILHARLTLPPNFDKTKKYPAILGSVYSNTVHNQWGGRVAHPTWGLDQYLAQQGYVLLNVDVSGSSGHGKIFRQRIGLDYGGVDVEDLYSGVKFLESQGYVDMRRVGMWGSSYGGLLTATSLFTKPEVYKAGVAGAPATSLFHALTGEMRTMMAPQDHMGQYAKSSAFLKSGGLEDHLMLIHGMRDQVVLFKDSVTLEQRLILQGKDARLLVLPDAPHGWDTEGMAQTRYAYRQMIDYFDRYLGADPKSPK
jgi:dipeptidyl-peptidase-4